MALIPNRIITMPFFKNQSLVKALMGMSPHAHALLDTQNYMLLAWNEAFASLCNTPLHQGAELVSLGLPVELKSLVSAQASAVMSGKNVSDLPQPHFKLPTSAGEMLYAARLIYVSADGRRAILSLQRSGSWDMLAALLRDGSLYDFFPDMVSVHDLSGRILACNQAACAFLHKSREEIIGSALEDLLEEDAGATARKLFYHCVSTGNPQATNLSFTHNGRFRSLIVTVDPILDSSNQLVGALSVAYDDTQHQLMDETLQRRGNLLQASSRAAQQLLADTDDFDDNMNQVLAILGEATSADRVYVWRIHESPDPERRPGPHASQLYEWSLNAAPQQNFALTRNQSLTVALPDWLETFQAGKCVNKLAQDLPPADQAWFAAQGITSILSAPILFHGELWGFIGFDDCHSQYIWSESEENILRAAGTLIGTAIHNHRTNAALRESEDRFRMVAEATGEIIWSINEHGNIDYVSDRVTAVLGYSPQELIGRELSVLQVPPTSPMPDARPHDPIVVREKDVFCKNGSIKWLRTSFNFVFDDNGVMRKGFATSLEIPDPRETAEEACSFSPKTEEKVSAPNPANL